MSTFITHLAGALAIAVLLVLGIMARVAWCKNVFRSADKTVAAILGFSGYHTLSYECGHGDSALCNALRPCIDFVFGEGHCTGAPD